MVTFLIIALFIGVIVFDLIPNIKKNKAHKSYCVFYISVIILTSTVLVLKSLNFELINTYDIINLFVK